MRTEPRYCCAILTDSRGRYIFEKRPANEPDAPGVLTCFGGGREENEGPESCLRRELLEELGFVAGFLERVFTLHTPRGEAWFYKGQGPEEGSARALEEGFEAMWVHPTDPDMNKVGRWHRAALDAIARGERQIRID